MGLSPDKGLLFQQLFQFLPLRFLAWLETLVQDKHKEEGAGDDTAQSPGMGQGRGWHSAACPRAGEKLLCGVCCVTSNWRHRETLGTISKGLFYSTCSIFFNPVNMKYFPLLKTRSV